jgi:hypothetical protein
MAPQRLTTTQALERNVIKAAVVFAALFVAGTYSLRPYTVELPTAFRGTDPGPFPFTFKHVGVGASAPRWDRRAPACPNARTRGTAQRTWPRAWPSWPRWCSRSPRGCSACIR